MNGRNIMLNSNEEIYKALRPLEFPSLIRVGGFKDGGYILPSAYLRDLTTYINFGVGEDFDFEIEIKNLCPGLRIESFDNLVSLRYFLIHAFKGVAKFILKRANFSVAYHRLFLLFKYIYFYLLNPHIKFNKIEIDKDRASDVFLHLPLNCGLKIDIEGSEYQILDCITQNKSKFIFIIIEFHSVELHNNKIIEFISDMNSEFQVAHTSFNNRTSDVSCTPQTIEVTFCKKNNKDFGYIDRLPNTKLDWHFPNRPIYELEFSE
jgi:hypothetical protein